MRSPSASASRSARASRLRVQSSPVRAHGKKVHGMGKLLAVVNGAVANRVSVVRSFWRQHR